MPSTRGERNLTVNIIVNNETVVKDKVAMLSNYEVLSLLQNISKKERGKKPIGHRQPLATVTYETTKYLEKQPCRLQSEEDIKKFLQSVAPFKLTKAEKLQLLNHRPVTPVEIQVIVEECEERLDQEQIDNLLDVVANALPGETPTEDDAMDQR